VSRREWPAVRAVSAGYQPQHSHRRTSREAPAADGVIEFPLKNDGGGLDRTADLAITSAIERDQEEPA
jgi:hypothetical protein